MLETKGQRTRNSILETAAALATEEGLEPLSIGRLAEETGMSKSGLFAHFGSKEELQLATVEYAATLFVAEVIEPARSAPRGLARIWALCDHMIGYSERQVFPGGCFFASVLSEMDTRPGPVRDRLVGFLTDWLGRLEAAIRQAQEEGSLAAGEEPVDLAFELESTLFFANAQYVVSGTREPIERARRIVERRLARATR